MASRQGIEANPEKIQVIVDMAPPKSIKKIQRVIGRITTLSRFVSKSTNRCLPFFQTLKKAFCFFMDLTLSYSVWKTENLPILTTLLVSLNDARSLYLHLTTSDNDMAVVLVKEQDEL